MGKKREIIYLQKSGTPCRSIPKKYNKKRCINNIISSGAWKATGVTVDSKIVQQIFARILAYKQRKHCPIMLPTYLIYCMHNEHNHNFARAKHRFAFNSDAYQLHMVQKLIVSERQHVRFAFAFFFIRFYFFLDHISSVYFFLLLFLSFDSLTFC